MDKRKLVVNCFVLFCLLKPLSGSLKFLYLNNCNMGELFEKISYGSLTINKCSTIYNPSDRNKTIVCQCQDHVQKPKMMIFPFSLGILHLKCSFTGNCVIKKRSPLLRNNLLLEPKVDFVHINYQCFQEESNNDTGNRIGTIDNKGDNCICQLYSESCNKTRSLRRIQIRNISCTVDLFKDKRRTAIDCRDSSYSTMFYRTTFSHISVLFDTTVIWFQVYGIHGNRINLRCGSKDKPQIPKHFTSSCPRPQQNNTPASTSKHKYSRTVSQTTETNIKAVSLTKISEAYIKRTKLTKMPATLWKTVFSFRTESKRTLIPTTQEAEILCSKEKDFENKQANNNIVIIAVFIGGFVLGICFMCVFKDASRLQCRHNRLYPDLKYTEKSKDKTEEMSY